MSKGAYSVVRLIPAMVRSAEVCQDRCLLSSREQDGGDHVCWVWETETLHRLCLLVRLLLFSCEFCEFRLRKRYVIFPLRHMYAYNYACFYGIASFKKNCSVPKFPDVIRVD